MVGPDVGKAITLSTEPTAPIDTVLQAVHMLGEFMLSMRPHSNS